MSATSEKQRRLFGMVLAMKRGKLDNPSAEVQKVAGGISESSAADFAGSIKKKQGIAKSLMTKY